MSYLRNQNQSQTEDLNEFEDKSQTNYTQKETNLYNKYKENAANQRFQRSAEGIPAISAEDFHLLRNCNRESFWYRCLPLSTGICAVMFYMARQKQKTPKIWHIMSGTFMGWFFGKLSYRRTCEDRLINSDSNSPFVAAMRRRRGVHREDLSLGSGAAEAQSDQSGDQYWDSETKDFSGAFKDSNYGYNSGYGAQEFADYKEEDSHRKDENEETKAFTTYDDLRARNRAAFKPQNSSRPFSA